MSINLDPSTWRLFTLLGIPYKLKEGSPTFSASRDGNMAVKETIIIEADNLMSFIAESVPVSEAFPGGVWAYIPARSYPGIPSLLTQSTEAKPFDTSKPADPTGIDPGASSGTYGEFMEVDVTYSTNEATTQDEDEGEATTFLEVSSDAGAEIVAANLEGSATYTSLEGDSDEEAGTEIPVKDINNLVTKIVPQIEWTVSFPLVTNAVMDIILGIARPLLGKINSVTMPVLKGPSIGTIIFTSMSLRESYAVDSEGVIQKQNQLEMKFSEKRITESGESVSSTYVVRFVDDGWYVVDSDGNKIQGPFGSVQAASAALRALQEEEENESDAIKGWNYFFIKEVQGFRLVKVNDKLTYGSADLNQLWA